MHNTAFTRNMAHFVQLCIFFAVTGLAVQALADESVDCTRYRIAGLPCPPLPAGASPLTAPATRPTVAPTVVSRPSTPANVGAFNSIAPTRTAPAPTGLAPGPTATTGSEPTQTRNPVQPSLVSSGGPPANLPFTSLAPLPSLAPTAVSVPPVTSQPPATPTPTPIAPATLPFASVPSMPNVATPFARPTILMPGSALMPLALTPLPAPIAPREGREPGQIVVYWTAAEDAATDLAALLQDRHMAPTSMTRLEHLGGVIAVFQLATPALANEARALLRKDFPAATVDFNTRYRPLLQPPTQPRLYLPQKVDQPNPGTNLRGGAGVRVGIVDGPVARTTALGGAKIVRRSFLTSTEIAAPVGHATSIASLIAGQDPVAGFFGIARQASLFSAEIMRAVGPDDMTNSSALIRALDWLLAEKVQLINLSLGGPGDQVMEKAFAKLATMNVVVVAAAGNGGPSAPPAYPAAYPGVIAVTATDAADNLYVQANRGSYIALAAPGVDIWVPDTEMGHYVSGTSFSAAVVTGAAALLLEQGAQSQLKTTMPQRLCRGARDIGARGSDAMYGCGVIQIGTLLREDRS